MKLQVIKSKIHEIRGHKIMLDFDLAELYETETRILKQSVKRNIKRFPEDFMFQLTVKEVDNMVSQNVIPSKSYLGGTLPFAFTEQGVAMLSGILNSDKAIEINISVMRAFVFLRNYALTHKDLTEKLKKMERKYNQKFSDIDAAINYLLQKDQEVVSQQKRKRIGFKIKGQ